MTTPLKFLLETKGELSKVVFPTQKEIIRLTILVITVSLAVGLFIGGIDFLFTTIVTRLLR